MLLAASTLLIAGAMFWGYQELQKHQINPEKKRKRRRRRKQKTADPRNEPIEQDSSFYAPPVLEEVYVDDNSVQLNFISRGRKYFKQHLYQQALDCFIQALIDDAANARINLNVARCYFRLGNLEMAMQYAGIAHVLDKSTYESLYIQGMVLLKQEKLKQAKETFIRLGSYSDVEARMCASEKLKVVDELIKKAEYKAKIAAKGEGDSDGQKELN